MSEYFECWVRVQDVHRFDDGPNEQRSKRIVLEALREKADLEVMEFRDFKYLDDFTNDESAEVVALDPEYYGEVTP